MKYYTVFNYWLDDFGGRQSPNGFFFKLSANQLAGQAKIFRGRWAKCQHRTCQHNGHQVELPAGLSAAKFVSNNIYIN